MDFSELIINDEKDLLRVAHKNKITLKVNWGKDIVHLCEICVPEKIRRCGWGSFLIENIIKLAKDRPVSVIVNDCFGTPVDVLLPFYRKFGFCTEYKDIDSYYMFLGHPK